MDSTIQIVTLVAICLLIIERVFNLFKNLYFHSKCFQGNIEIENNGPIHSRTDQV